jgi:RNA polymerase sigma-70 factor (ECF subfamily)
LLLSALQELVTDDSLSSPVDLNAFLSGVERRAYLRALRATRDRDEALDLVQDAMLKLSRHYETRPGREWPALFQRILTNRIRDWQRRQAVRRRLFFWRDTVDPREDEIQDRLDGIVDPAQVDGATALVQAEQLRKVMAALDKLPARQREAFELRVWEGLPVADTARAMGCSEGSVKTHLSRAMASLRDAAERELP